MAENSETAFDCFRQALKHDQRHWESHYNLGNLYFDSGQHDPSRVHYEVAAEIEPGFRNVHFNLALILALEAEYGAAVEALERFRELAPEEEAEADIVVELRRAVCVVCVSLAGGNGRPRPRRTRARRGSLRLELRRVRPYKRSLERGGTQR